MEKPTQSLDCGRHFEFPGGGGVAKYRAFCSPNMHLKLRDRHLGLFSLSLWSHSIPTSPNGKLDPENICIAVGISLKSCLGAEINVFEVVRPPSLIFPLPVWSCSILHYPSGKLDPNFI